MKRNQGKATHFHGARGQGPIHGTAGLAESLEATGHPSGASRADHTLVPYRPQDAWRRQGTDGGASTRVCACVNPFRRDCLICQVEGTNVLI